jgi:NADH-quinone oxidoreductase subunit N
METTPFDSSIFFVSREGWLALSPFLILCAGIFFATVGAGFKAGLKTQKVLASLFFGAFIWASAKTLGQPEIQLFGTSLVINNFVKLVSCVLGTICLLGSLFVSDSRAHKMHSEWLPILFVHVLGLALLPAAGDFVSFFVYLETFALTGYVMAALDTGREKSLEAGLKYLMTGAFASGFFLMGVTLLFGSTGNLSFQAVSEILKSDVTAGHLTLALVGILFVVASLLFKVGNVPFHMWAPDVYQAAPTAMASILATAGKVSVFASVGVLGVRVGFFEFQIVKDFLFWTGAASVIIGSFCAISQRSLRRLLAYSGIVNGGYVTLSFSLGAAVMGSAIVNLLIYSVTFIATLAIVEKVLESQGIEPHGDILLSDLGASFKKVNGFWGVLFALLIFSTAGMPPLPGFFGKYLLLKDAWASGGQIHVGLILLGTLLGLFYYLKTIVVTLLKEISIDEMKIFDRYNVGDVKATPVLGAATIVALLATVVSVWALSGLSRLPQWVHSAELFSR